MDSTADRQRALCDRLLDKTKDGTIKWDFDGFSDVPFTSFGEIRVELKFDSNRNEEPLVTVIISKEGFPIDQFTDEDLPDQPSVEGGRYRSYFELLCDLRQIALRQAKGVDEVLDDLLRYLD